MAPWVIEIQPVLLTPCNIKKTLLKIDEAMENSKKEKFVKHLLGTYGEIPVWAMVEVASFGTVVRIYHNLHESDQIHIARRYASRHDILASYLHHLSVVRNMCAHHARLWDRIFYGVRPLNKWRQKKLPVNDTQHLFYTLLVVHHLTQHIPQSCFDRAAWKQELVALLKNFATLPNCDSLKIMGIPANGFDDVWWE
jgi:abortive infection bacteriophage resistance protein